MIVTDRLQSVAENVYFQAYLLSDGKTPATGKTIAIQLSKNGGAYGNPSVGAANLTEIGNGTYYFAASATDMNTLGPLSWLGTSTGVDNVIALDFVRKATNRGMSALPDAAVNTVGGFAGEVLAAGTATAGSASSLTLQTALSNANLARRAYVRIIAGTGAGQTANIASHTTTVLTFDRAMAVALDATSVYIIVYGNAPATTSAGAVPPEWSQISNPTSTVSLPNTTIGTVTSIGQGAIDFAQFSAAFLAYTQRARLITTGATTPVSADPAWNVAGSWNNEPAYQNSAKTLWAWNNGGGWTISATLGTNGASYWTSATTVNGTYTAQGSAVGTPTVVAHGNAILSGFEPDITFPTAAQVGTIPTTGTIAKSSDIPTVVQIRQEMDTNSAKLDVTVGSRLASSGYTVPPTAASNASAVWGTVITGSVQAGTIMASIYTVLLTGISSSLVRLLGLLAGKTAGDTAANADIHATVSGGTYNNTTKSLEAQTGGSGGGGDSLVDGFTDDGVAALQAALATRTINVQSPLTIAKKGEPVTFQIVQGDDYYQVDGRALTFPDLAGSWPDWTGATATVEVAGLVIPATLGNRTGTPRTGVYFELSSEQTTALFSGVDLVYCVLFDLIVVLQNTTNRTTVVSQGVLEIRQSV